MNKTHYPGKLVIGLYGRYASGKSTLAKVFEDHGYEVIEVDHLGHQALIDKKSNIIKEFGKNITDETGEIDRKKLGALVFDNPKALARLENIVHPLMCELVETMIERSNSSKILINAAILVKMNLNTLCDRIIMINASMEKMIEWGIKRDKISPEDIEKRLKNQSDINIDDSYADQVLENDGNPDELKSQGEILINNLEREFGK